MGRQKYNFFNTIDYYFKNNNLSFFLTLNFHYIYHFQLVIILKKNLLIIGMLVSVSVIGQNIPTNSPKNYEEIIEIYNRLTMQQINDTARYYLDKKSLMLQHILLNLLQLRLDSNLVLLL
jgi:uncharacterized protein (DUF433 family)